MSEANVEVVRKIYEVWRSRGGREIARKLMAPDIEWVNPDDAVEPGLRRGLHAFDEAVDSINETFDRVEVVPKVFYGVRDQVVVVGVMRTRGRGSGVVQETPQGYVWTLRDGRAVRFQWFNEPREALEAAGLDPKLAHLVS
jgi:ketosteroid isomerase-like protein